ncbi:MAG: TIGR03862 family flavoprotein [Rhodobacterales bacterium]|nr:TIGR03862 family flavoprotein [Rhodobacterales bacterium]
MISALVIGAGPAGLMAAEELGRAGYSVTIADAMPSAGRKFLMAGKSGLNLTKDEPLSAFLAAYSPLAPQLETALRAFGPAEVMDWSRALGQPVFTGTSGRVFPVAMKASPLLRAWFLRLESLGVNLRTRWRWQGWDGDQAVFSKPEGLQCLRPPVTILTLGGASWARLGSDGTWTSHFPGQTAAFQPANMGFVVNWSPHMNPHFGQPVKGTAQIAGSHRSRGEFVISARGIEGGGIYALSRALRDGAALTLDLLPDLALSEITARLARDRGKRSLSNHLRQSLHLDPVRLALLNEFGRPFPDNLAPLLKSLPIALGLPRPIDEAISTAGGLRFDALDDTLMLRSRPGTFAAGEMLDWEAPTGGYLLTACLATGRLAGRSAVNWLTAHP